MSLVNRTQLLAKAIDTVLGADLLDAIGLWKQRELILLLVRWVLQKSILEGSFDSSNGTLLV